MTDGRKDDSEKPSPFRGVVQAFPRALDAVATVASFGARKYEWDNWKEVDQGYIRYSDAMMRHLLSEASGKPLDDESGELHAVHVAWNALARLELLLAETEKVEF